MKMFPWLSPIHDVTTDTETPPSFVAILPLRENAPNSPEYGGKEAAALQKRVYPDVQPLTLTLPCDTAFDRAGALAREMGWAVVAEARESGRIEATATTFWFRFKDDVVIRITALECGSRVDVRSVSRVGRSDLGTNARRVRRFLRHMQFP